MDSSAEPVCVKQFYAIGKNRLWSAITEADLMRQWFFDAIPAFEPKIGFETQFLIQNEGRNYTHQWRVTEVDPESRICYSWNYAECDGDSEVCWELSESEDGSTLVLTHRVIEDFPADDPSFSREAGIAGWNYFLKESLFNFLS